MKKLILFLLNIYKAFVSPIIKILFGGGCRFTQTCSEYTIEAVSKFGVIKGLSLGLQRILKCNPFTFNSRDPVTQV